MSMSSTSPAVFSGYALIITGQHDSTLLKASYLPPETLTPLTCRAPSGRAPVPSLPCTGRSGVVWPIRSEIVEMFSKNWRCGNKTRSSYSYMGGIERPTRSSVSQLRALRAATFSGSWSWRPYRRMLGLAGPLLYDASKGA